MKKFTVESPHRHSLDRLSSPRFLSLACLTYQEPQRSESAALKREAAIKQLRRETAPQ